MKINIFFNLFVISIFGTSLLLSQPIDHIKNGDEFFNKRNTRKNGKPDVSIINQAIENYKKALKLTPQNDKLLYKYTRAIDFKYISLPNKYNNEEKEKVYLSLVNNLKRAYKNNPDSKYLNYSLAVAWGRYGQLIGVMTAGGKGIGGKVKKFGEKLYKIDKKFRNCSAGMLLGRLHYKAPYIPFILTWPDIDESKKYLEEVVKNKPDNYRAKFYLADTLYEMDEKEKAMKYFNEVINMKLRDKTYFEDLQLKNKCKGKMRKLGL